jgi:ribosomal protein S18 acetylase RimI-like enzyme
MMLIRPYRTADLDGIVAMNHRSTRSRFADHDLIPDTLVRPYLVAEPDLAYVVEDAGRVVGYLLGTASTMAFANWWQRCWLLHVAHRHPRPDHEPQTLQDHWIVRLHTPRQWLVRDELADYPAHLHIGLERGYRRRGLGRRLLVHFIDGLRERSVPALHVSYLTANVLAAAFYQRMGFRVLDVPDTGAATCAGRSTEPGPERVGDP